MHGTMLWFNEDKGFGFIRTDDGERLVVHANAFAPGHAPSGRCAGVSVSFERVDGDEPRAVAVTIVEESPQLRARMRHHARR
jgi:cold shock CspA family protein